MAFRPDRAFRIADRRHPIFDGTGAYRSGARWNSPGRRVIYAADSYPGAVLEILVHSRIGKLPRTQAWIEIGIPADVSLERFEGKAPEASLARSLGDAWHEERRSLILLVPSVVTAGISLNVLINQEHPEFSRLKASKPREVIWDERLFGG